MRPSLTVTIAFAAALLVTPTVGAREGMPRAAADLVVSAPAAGTRTGTTGNVADLRASIPAVGLRTNTATDTSDLGASNTAGELIRVETLPNGVTLLIEERPGCGTFAIETTAMPGSIADPDDLLGLTSLLGRMLLRGSETITAADQAQRVARTGSSLDARGSTSGVTLSASGPATGFMEVFDVLADAALHPLFDGEDLRKEIALARQSLRSSMDSGSSALTRAALPVVYGSHPLGRVARDPESYLVTAGVDAVRRVYSERFVGRRVVVIIVGAVEGAAAYDRVVQTFGILPEGAALPPAPASPQPLTAEIRKRERRRTSQPEILVAMPTRGVADDDAPAMDVLAHILGGFQERLSAALREKRGWAYWLGAWDVRHTGAGLFGIRTAVPRRHLPETEQIIKEAFASIAAAPPTAEEVDRAQQYLLTSLARSWQQSDARAYAFDAAWTHGRPIRTYAEIAARYERVTPEIVQTLARRLMDSSKLAVVTLY